MNILAFDTSTDLLNLAINSKDNFFHLSEKIERQYSEKLVSRLKWALDKQNLSFKDLSLVVCAKGPGSFTALRVGMAAAKGIALAANIDLVSVSTTEVYAYPFKHLDYPTLVLIDAKKRRFYNAIFYKGERLTTDSDSTLAEISANISKYEQIMVTGLNSKESFAKLCDEVTSQNIATKLHYNELYSSGIGQSMIILGKKLLKAVGADPIEAGPTYVRKSDAELSLTVEN